VRIIRERKKASRVSNGPESWKKGGERERARSTPVVPGETERKGNRKNESSAIEEPRDGYQGV